MRAGRCSAYEAARGGYEVMLLLYTHRYRDYKQLSDRCKYTKMCQISFTLLQLIIMCV
jgi:hypothetical protein